MRSVWGWFLGLWLLLGCRAAHIRLGSPQFQKKPGLTCVIVVESDKDSVELAKAALDACLAAQKGK